MDISEVVRATGVPASTIRFYEEKGLIESIGRKGLKRTFDPEIIDRLALIALGQAAGFALNELRPLLRKKKIELDREVLRAKADELDATIEHLIRVRDTLRHTANCTALTHMECATFRRLLRHASAAQTKPAKPSAERL